jgi:hypothetical protein
LGTFRIDFIGYVAYRLFIERRDAMPATAQVRNVYSAYGNEPERVRITRSKARAAGPTGVTFYAPGWRAMVFKSMEAAQRKLQSHPGFVAWEA